MGDELVQREAGICRRLREFRESKRISRTAFAVALGIGGERLASYESGRVPLRYEIFRLLTQHFFLNPSWLATGNGVASLQKPFDDSDILPFIKPRSLFSAAYDGQIAYAFDQEVFDAGTRADAALKAMGALFDDEPSLKRLAKEHPVPLGELAKRAEGFLDWWELNSATYKAAVKRSAKTGGDRRPPIAQRDRAKVIRKRMGQLQGELERVLGGGSARNA